MMRRQPITHNLALIAVLCTLLLVIMSGCANEPQVSSRVTELTNESIDRAKYELGLAEPTPVPTPNIDQEETPYEAPVMWANEFHTVSVEFDENTGTLHFVLSNPNEDNELYNCIAPFSGDLIKSNYGTSWSNAYRSQVKRIVVDEGITGIEALSFINLGTEIDVELPQTILRIEAPLARYTTTFNSFTLKGTGRNLVVRQNALYVKDTTSEAYALVAYAGESTDETFTLASDIWVTSIEESAFEMASNLKRVDLSGGTDLTYIADRAFYMCNKLERVSLPDQLVIANVNDIFVNCAETLIVSGGQT